MKKFLFMAFAVCAMSLSAQDIKTEPVVLNDQKTPEVQQAPAPAPKPYTVRYVDADKLFEEYLAAQKYAKLRTKLNNDYKQAEDKKRKQIETFYNQVQTKYQNNQYKNEAAFEADKKKLEQMQETGQKEMEALQKKMESQLNTEYSKVLKEINNYLGEYATKNEIDALHRTDATMFVNPKLIVTDEIIKGLNDRYNAQNPPAAKKSTGSTKKTSTNKKKK